MKKRVIVEILVFRQFIRKAGLVNQAKVSRKANCIPRSHLSILVGIFERESGSREAGFQQEYLLEVYSSVQVGILAGEIGFRKALFH